MEEYLDRLEMCGWRRDQAWVLIEDFIKEMDFEALDEFIRLEECGLCM